jgi:hypothetical protein|tara:strand:- start:731 stop:862 length:132 start_codon:yes stop_codon:yes gene_type:complete
MFIWKPKEKTKNLNPKMIYKININTTKKDKEKKLLSLIPDGLI